MILFKACPRCGGDVDTTQDDDVRCIQCAHRPDAAALAAHRRPGGPPSDGAGAPDTRCTCPRCESAALVLLDRLRDEDNYCYRCRPCGHVFSPASKSTA